MKPAGDGQVSTMLVDESFATGDDEFVERLRSIISSRYLATLADRWKQDPRPWARDQLIRYVSFPLDRPGHHPLVKRLFKHAESLGDHELMGVFLVAFDRLVRRERRTRYRYDFQAGETTQSEELFAPRNAIKPSLKERKVWDRATGKQVMVPIPMAPRHGMLFSYTTRHYLRRRAWRYFRWLGFRQPADYTRIVAQVLATYVDDDVATGENILDNWSLMHIAFHGSSVVQFKRTCVALADNRALSELVAAPCFPELWKDPQSAEVLLKLLTSAKSRLVRVWSMQLLKQDHVETLQAITAEQLLVLLDHTDEEVQKFGAGLLKTLAGIDSWPISTWLKLLKTRDMQALVVITEEMNRRVSRERLNLEQCVELACVRPTPVARMGLSWLEGRPVTTDADRAVLGRLARVSCEAVGFEAATWALRFLGAPSSYQLDLVCLFFDSLNSEVRRGAWEWLTPDSPGYLDPLLWCRLFETPYDDIRLKLVQSLSRRVTAIEKLSSFPHKDLTHVWLTVLLNVHRGGRIKLKALQQIVKEIADDPNRAVSLVPVLAVAIRSVRPAEVRAGLSALLTAISVRPELEPLVAQLIPELHVQPMEAKA